MAVDEQVKGSEKLGIDINENFLLSGCSRSVAKGTSANQPLESARRSPTEPFGRPTAVS